MEKFNNNNLQLYKIITMDDYGHLLVGHLEIKNRELLREFRDFLAKDSLDNFNFIERNSSCKNGTIMSNIEVVDNSLIKRGDFREEYIKTFYKEYIYEALNLNTFLLCSSLLKEMDITKFGKIANEFVKYDIFKLLPISEAWKKCSEDLYKNINSQDYETFSDLLADGRFIEYVIDEVIEYRNLKEARLIDELKMMLDDEVCINRVNHLNLKDFLKEVSHNSVVLGTCRKKCRLVK